MDVFVYNCSKMYFLCKLSISASFYWQIIFEVMFFYRFALVKPLSDAISLSSSILAVITDILHCSCRSVKHAMEGTQITSYVYSINKFVNCAKHRTSYTCSVLQHKLNETPVLCTSEITISKWSRQLSRKLSQMASVSAAPFSELDVSGHYRAISTSELSDTGDHILPLRAKITPRST